MTALYGIIFVIRLICRRSLNCLPSAFSLLCCVDDGVVAAILSFDSFVEGDWVDFFCLVDELMMICDYFVEKNKIVIS